MPKNKKFLRFPADFLWGSATSSHQVEGNNHNNWSVWEKKSASRLAQKAKKKWQPWQQKQFPQMLKKENYISGRACNHYHLFKKDFDLARSLGHNAHRFSLEWSRIEPQEGQFSQSAINHYKKVLKALRKRKLEPFVTLWHFTNPLWLAQKGGEENKKFPFYFERYTRHVFKKLGNLASFWITLNEPPNVILNSYLIGRWPPQKISLFSPFKIYRNLAKAHKKAYRVIHQLSPKNSPKPQVGFSSNYSFNEPFNKKSFLDNLACRFMDYFGKEKFLNLTKDHRDFLAVQYYFHNRIKFYKQKNENKSVSDLNWEIYPQGIYHVLKSFKKHNLPIYITENGLADAQDQKRAKFIKDHLLYVHKAIQEGVKVKGYFYWSLLDNFEWDKGFWPRFGLTKINYKTLERKVRPSAYAYKKICQKNGFLSNSP